MYSWGENSNGKLGVGDDVDRLVPTKIPIDFKVRQIACGDFHTAVLSGSFDIFDILVLIVNEQNNRSCTRGERVIMDSWVMAPQSLNTVNLLKLANLSMADQFIKSLAVPITLPL